MCATFEPPATLPALLHAGRHSQAAWRRVPPGIALAMLLVALGPAPAATSSYSNTIPVERDLSTSRIVRNLTVSAIGPLTLRVEWTAASDIGGLLYHIINVLHAASDGRELQYEAVVNATTTHVFLHELVLDPIDGQRQVPPLELDAGLRLAVRLRSVYQIWRGNDMVPLAYMSRTDHIVRLTHVACPDQGARRESACGPGRDLGARCPASAEPAAGVRLRQRLTRLQSRRRTFQLQPDVDHHKHWCQRRGCMCRP